MSQNNGIWSKTLNLLPGQYEFVFTKNFWEENGAPPLGSECDFFPCDEWANYGLIVSADSAPITLSTVCWGECAPCEFLSINEIPNIGNKKVIAIYDVLGRQVDLKPGELLFYHYDDGSVIKRISFE